jgi:hypothetical protein
VKGVGTGSTLAYADALHAVAVTGFAVADSLDAAADALDAAADENTEVQERLRTLEGRGIRRELLEACAELVSVEGAVAPESAEVVNALNRVYVASARFKAFIEAVPPSSPRALELGRQASDFKKSSLRSAQNLAFTRRQFHRARALPISKRLQRSRQPRSRRSRPGVCQRDGPGRPPPDDDPDADPVARASGRRCLVPRRDAALAHR